ncbi:MAG: hypothetical protein JW760_11835, partial [Spirochaetales bacterium]|nr:hypothetical protein [Spirochaetales bacterium]
MKKLIIMVILSILFFGSCFLYFFRDDSLGGWEIVGDQYFPEENIGALDLVWHPEDGLLLVLRYMNEGPDGDTIRVYRYADSKWVKYTDDLAPGFPGDTVAAGILESGDLCVVPIWATSGVYTWNGTAWTDIGDGAFAELGTRAAYFTEDGELLLALEDYNNECKLSIYTYNGVAWTLLGAGGDFTQPTEAWL